MIARLAIFIIVASCNTAFAGEAHIAVAANFLGPLKTVVKAFERATGHKALLSPGSTGQLYSQIINGAPYAVFLAADRRRPEMLERGGGVAKGSLFTYATGRLALYSMAKGFVDGNGDVLRSGRFNRLAMADPKTAPYGLAAKETLEKLGLYKKYRQKIVRGISVSQAFQFANSGSVELGFVALSQVKEFMTAGGSYWVVPDEMHAPIVQQGALLKRGAKNDAAISFVAFIKSDEAKKIIENSGYIVP